MLLTWCGNVSHRHRFTICIHLHPFARSCLWDYSSTPSLAIGTTTYCCRVTGRLCRFIRSFAWRILRAEMLKNDGKSMQIHPFVLHPSNRWFWEIPLQNIPKPSDTHVCAVAGKRSAAGWISPGSWTSSPFRGIALLPPTHLYESLHTFHNPSHPVSVDWINPSSFTSRLCIMDKPPPKDQQITSISSPKHLWGILGGMACLGPVGILMTANGFLGLSMCP